MERATSKEGEQCAQATFIVGVIRDTSTFTATNRDLRSN